MKKQLFCTGWKISNQPGKSMVEVMMGEKEAGREIVLPYDAMIHEDVTPDTKNAGQSGYYPGGYIITRKISRHRRNGGVGWYSWNSRAPMGGHWCTSTEIS